MRIFELVLCIVFLGMCPALQAENSVRIECPITNPVVDGDSIPIKVFITNDVPLFSFSIGLHWDRSEVAITTVKKGPDFQAGCIFKGVPLPAQQKVLVGMLNLMPGEGWEPLVEAHVATLYMRVPLGTPPMWVNIDSTFVPPAGYFIFDPWAGGAIYPDYIDCGTKDIRIGTGAVCGDVDGSGMINLTDAVYLVQYIFENGPAPDPVSAGDVDCNSQVDLSDVVYLAGYVFGGGPAPCAGCK